MTALPTPSPCPSRRPSALRRADSDGDGGKELDRARLSLVERKTVERAKGLLQTKQGMTEPEAVKWIQRAAMDRRTTMKRVAEVVLETLGDAADEESG